MKKVKKTHIIIESEESSQDDINDDDDTSSSSENEGQDKRGQESVAFMAKANPFTSNQPSLSSVERLGQIAISSFLKPSSRDNIFNAFFKSTYMKDSWVHYSLTQPVPNVTYKNLKVAMSFLLVSIVL